MAWIHPVIGLVALVAMFVAAKLGLDARRRGGARARVWHRKIRYAVLGVCVFAGVIGVASMAWLRPELHLRDAPGTSPVGHTPHFWAGLATVALMAIAATVPPDDRESPGNKTFHPVLGLLACAAVLLAALLGLRMLP